MLAVGVVHGWLVVDVCGWGFHVFSDVCVGLCGFVAGATFGHGNLCEHAVIAIRQSRLPPTHLGHSHHAQPHTSCCDTMLCAHGAVTTSDVVIDCTHWTVNNIGAEGARAIAEALKVNSSLQNLNLNSKCPPLHGSPCVVCFGCCSRCWWLWRCWAWGRVCAASQSVGPGMACLASSGLQFCVCGVVLVS